ncbi:MAG: DUF2892 domain-containing protein [Gammaproteobacteria bacterium]|jgi:hypothetical protein|nr:DUF2892 domain-containing protein [Gammaproteobacteria bacterium]
MNLNNVGKVDRIIRLVLGVALLAAGWVYQSWWGLAGLVPLGTAAIGWCPPYALLGINTCGKSA